MDGVLVHGGHAIAGAVAFIQRLQAAKLPFLVVTNNALRMPRDHQATLSHLGVDISVDAIFTSALALAAFLNRQRPHGSAFVIGEAGLTTALHEIEYVLSDNDPDYVVLGETTTFDMARITTAIQLINRGARFVVTSPDPVVPTAGGIAPAPGAIAAMIERATGARPYYVGKPNPFMFRSALDRLGVHARDTVFVGDSMDTDVIGGLEAGLTTVLVLSGRTRADDIGRYAWRPDYIRKSVAEIEPGNLEHIFQEATPRKRAPASA